MINAKNIRILFMGTPNISAQVLEFLLTQKYNVIGVIAQEDKPVGRKHELMPVPTKVVANKYNIPVYQKTKIRLDYEFVKDLKPDLILTLAYGQIIPQGLIDIPKYGCLNLHGSLLPKYRGAAPIQYALFNNEKVTGMSLMEMTAQMDAGRVYATDTFDILDDDNASSLFVKMGDSAIRLISNSLEKYLNGELEGIAQDETKVSFCPTIKKEEEKLNLDLPVDLIYGRIRGLSDIPGAYLLLENEKIKFFKASVDSYSLNYPVGEIIDVNKNGLFLQCKDGVIKITDLQREGKKRLNIKDFYNGNANLKGKILH